MHYIVKYLPQLKNLRLINSLLKQQHQQLKLQQKLTQQQLLNNVGGICISYLSVLVIFVFIC